jgi:hypothetical protein
VVATVKVADHGPDEFKWNRSPPVTGSLNELPVAVVDDFVAYLQPLRQPIPPLTRDRVNVH